MGGVYIPVYNNISWSPSPGYMQMEMKSIGGCRLIGISETSKVSQWIYLFKAHEEN